MKRRRPAGGSNQLRIIGGQWRGRKLRFADLEGLRPTPDRVRETLFNWLQFELPRLRVLDLFSGSGALALEALSRGAPEALLVERAGDAVRQLRANLELLGCRHAEVMQEDALALVARPAPAPFGLVFLDPPFRQGLLAEACAGLEANGWLQPGARIYVEAERELTSVPVPPNWRLHRRLIAGQVQSLLYLRDAGEPA